MVSAKSMCFCENVAELCRNVVFRVGPIVIVLFVFIHIPGSFLIY